MNRISRWSRLLSATLCCVACERGAPPSNVKVELPDVITSKDPVLVHARAIESDGTARDLRGELNYQVTPGDLASVTQGGRFVCNRSGEGWVALHVSGVQGRAPVACKLVARVDAPDKLGLDAAAGEQALQIRALDAAGQPLDLPVSVTSDRASVLQVRGGRLVPGAVGNAKLTARVGSLTHTIAVEVVRTLKPEVLPVDQNRRISYSLDAGKYRLTLQLPTPRRVRVDWLGAPYCAYLGEAAEHRVECTMQGKGSVSFDNPAFLLRGDKTPSVEGVTLQEVP